MNDLIKTKILEVLNFNKYDMGSKVKVKVDLKNKKGDYRNIEIGVGCFNELKLKENSQIMTYQDKRYNLKINYPKTFELYGKTYKKYYTREWN
jgi:hypothetical protein